MDESFAVIAQNPPEGVTLFNRVIDPVLFISRNNGVNSASLSGRRMVRGEEILYRAHSLNHNWVENEQEIRPLPTDIPQVVAHKLNGFDPSNLSFADVVKIKHAQDDEIEVHIDASIFKSANEAAEEVVESGEVPGLQATLFPYQKRGVDWMQQTLQRTGGVILADEMGLGKTMQIISLFLLNKPDTSSPALVICPTSLIANWQREVGKFAPELSTMIHRGSDRTGIYKGLMKAQVVITTYNTMVNDISLFRSVNWTFVVCDEAQALKNPSSKRRKCAVQVPRKFTVPVTGTPVENSLTDLWSLVDYSIPNLLGECSEFEMMYPNTEEAADELASVINPIILKRQVADVAKDLPERIDIDTPIELGSSLSEGYERVRVDCLNRYGAAGALVATGQLALFCAHPNLRCDDTSSPDWEDSVTEADQDQYPLFTPKMERLVDLLSEAFSNNRKVLIFANFNRCGEMFLRAAKQKELHKAFWGAVNGSTPQEERQQIIDRFTEYDGPAVLVLNPRAAGAGLNITAATIVIHYTQVWNPAIEAQASARAHRRGQTMPVTIYRLYYKDTVEEVMLERTLWKSQLANKAVPILTRENEDLSKALEISPSVNP
ncbi:DEAD/DEAH box helicase [Verrucomicrobia bacterium]|nr:DEAD/DEAH box helicase [Verrucomicrobiota bacterium]